MNFSGIGLRKRIVLYATIGLTLLVSAFAYIALDAVGKSSDTLMEERLVFARSIASRIDQMIILSGAVINTGLRQVATVPLVDGEVSPHQQIMLESVVHSLTEVNAGTAPISMTLHDSTEKHLWNAGAAFRTGFVDPTGEDVVSVSQTEDANPAVVISRSVNGFDSSLQLVALILPDSRLLSLDEFSDENAARYRVELIDYSGKIVTSGDGGDMHEVSRHAEVIEPLIDGGEGGVLQHESPGDESIPETHVVAFAPLANLPWGILLEQEEDIALALPNSLRRRIWIATVVALVGGLAAAWFTSSQVSGPLKRLTRRSQLLAQGDLTSEVLPEGQDEIKQLAEAFEIMRFQLNESVSELEQWGSELESRVRRRTAELEARNLERDALLDKVITAQENERTRVARELHDQVGQSLTALVMQLGASETQLVREGSGGADRIRLAREGLSEAIEGVRRLISDLRPSVLDDMGLASAVRWYAEQRLVDAGIGFEITVDPIRRLLPPATEISVFRIFQESINNAIKHAEANKVSVSLRLVDDQLEGEVVDDGIGFDPQAVVPGNDGGWAVGLIGLRERANLLNGTIEIQSSPGQGSRVSFRIPAKSEQTR